MTTQFYQLANKLFEKTLQWTGNLRLPFGAARIPTFTSPNTLHISSNKNDLLEKLIQRLNIRDLNMVRETCGTTIVVINGALWSIDTGLLNQLEEYLNGQKNNKKRVAKNA